ncbi:uncharacterized protein EV420DRAFT_1582817 [Desarmillaria tabescens]|uniref:Uncharacterized protein n=1 Tax=Armillaria tabescens TaxID=1929756 RepID=A0AA39JDZ2_ARMTA|nr:uncharacterized protein EV420DRAFT_1582817 [Desarmillaria tabescens]KAK0440006.1 hypothetical protein EV420DRAFT_1582817 [Desarmillaria tabescens]
MKLLHPLPRLCHLQRGIRRVRTWWGPFRRKSVPPVRNYLAKHVSRLCSSKRLKENHGGWSTPTTSCTVSSDKTDEEDASECGRYVHGAFVLPSRVPIPVERPAVNMNRKILPLPKRAELPAPVDPREIFLKSLIPLAQFPGEKARKTDEERLYSLQQDPCIDVDSISRQRVDCNKCRSSVLLDRRRNAGYYASAWVKHKNTCLEVYRACS